METTDVLELLWLLVWAAAIGVCVRRLFRRPLLTFGHAALVQDARPAPAERGEDRSPVKRQLRTVRLRLGGDGEGDTAILAF